MGRLHRSIRHCGANGCGDGRLSGRDIEETDGGTRRVVQLSRFDSSRERRRATAVASEGDDRGNHRGELVADHVESSAGRGGDETPSHARHRRHGEQFDSHPDRDAGDLRVVARAGIAKVEIEFSRVDVTVGLPSGRRRLVLGAIDDQT